MKWKLSAYRPTLNVLSPEMRQFFRLAERTKRAYHVMCLVVDTHTRHACHTHTHTGALAQAAFDT